MKTYTVYVLKSVENGNIYIGFSSNIEKRLKQHNTGKVKSTTHDMPYCICHKEVFSDKKSAVKMEKYLKSGCGRGFLKRLLKNNYSK